MATPIPGQMEEAAVVRFEALGNWTLVERVMMDHRNEDTTDGILDRIGIADAMALGATCTRARMTWLQYKGKVFNLNKFLTYYVHDAPAFRQMMESTASVVTGRCVAEMLRRNNPFKHPLVLVTGGVQASVVRLHLEEEQGYTAFGETEYWAETRSVTTYARVRGIRPSKVNLRSAFLSRKATMRREFPIEQMLTLSKVSESGSISYVILQVPQTCISKTVMSAGTNLAFYERASTVLENEDYDLLQVHEGKNQIREMGDSDCWTLLYDERGDYTSEYSSAAFAKKKDDLEGNSWFLHVVDGRMWHGVEAARLSDFDTNL
ncbi:hypothetical protein HWV62_32846 [Athelia sp. TMB]|nr:hypothetical protein HWV62_32846 [Athelia sp. TMB]